MCYIRATQIKFEPTLSEVISHPIFLVSTMVDSLALNGRLAVIDSNFAPQT